jgi:glycosyltransferase involved in cell wall biosynthesis
MVPEPVASPDTQALSGLMATVLEPAPPAAPALRPAAQSRRRTRPVVTIVMPVMNEAENLAQLLTDVRQELARIEGHDFEILVVDDGSTDGSGNVARELGARVVRHPTNLGNGAAVKRGIREASGDFILLMDGDGQHPPAAIPSLLAGLKDYDMVVGSRGGSGGRWYRNLANRTYNLLASYVTSKRIEDLTSGFRVARADVLKGFVHLLPNTFSYPTTITLAMFKAGYSVRYEPIEVRERRGKSKIHLLHDGSRFFLIILRVATFFSPLKVFVPLSLGIGLLGLVWYVYTYLTTHRFTNMAVLLLVQATMLFCLGLISEQVAQLRFERTEARSREETARPDGASAGQEGE